MLKRLLSERGVILTKELSDMVIADIKFNKIRFNKCTSLEEFLLIIERRWLIMNLYPHQIKALEEVKNFNRVGFFLDMGLG